MKQFLLLAFLLAAGVAWGQTDDPRRSAEGDELIRGSKVDFDVWEILRRGFEMALAPRVFRKNWPLYGYAITNNGRDDSCDPPDRGYPDFTVGKAAIVKQYIADRDSNSVEYIGLPLESAAVVESVQSSAEHAEFRTGEVCRWLREPFLSRSMLKIEALPHDLPEGS